MSVSAEGKSGALRRHGALVGSIALTLLVQILVSLIAMSVPVLAPEIAADRHLDPALIGFYPAFMYGAALLVLLHSGRLLDWLGPMGLSVVCVLISGLGLLLFMLPLPSVLPYVVGACLIGFGYGPTTPASSQILGSRSPPRMASLIFSIKQTGVPIGGVLAGVLIPSLIGWTSWRSTGLLIAFGAIMLGAALWPSVRRVDREYQKTGAGKRSFLDPLRSLLAIRPLRSLAIASLTFAGMQLCLSSFLTVHLVQGVHLRLVDAGVLFAAAQTASIVGRVGWGVVADHLLSPTATMVLLGLLMAGSAVATGCFDAGWPFGLMLTICLIYGASAAGWVGVVLSEVAKFSPPGMTGVMTGAAQSFMFIGVLIGPLLFSVVLSLTGLFRDGFIAIALFTLMGAGFAARAGAGRKSGGSG